MLIIWPILLPVNAVNQRGAAGGVSGMDILSISNINSNSPERYWAHVLVAIAFTCIPFRKTLSNCRCNMLLDVSRTRCIRSNTAGQFNGRGP